MNARENNSFDFFVNYERWSNNSIFYRLTVPLDMTKKVSGLVMDDRMNGLKYLKVDPFPFTEFRLDDGLKISDTYFNFHEYRINATLNSLSGLNPVKTSFAGDRNTRWTALDRYSDPSEGWSLINKDYGLWRIYGTKDIPNYPWEYLPEGTIKSVQLLNNPQNFSYTYSVSLYLLDKRTGIETQNIKKTGSTSFLGNFPTNVENTPLISEEIVCTLSFNGGPELDTYIVYDQDIYATGPLYRLCCPSALCFIKQNITKQYEPGFYPTSFDQRFGPYLQREERINTLNIGGATIIGDYSLVDFRFPSEPSFSLPLNHYGLYTVTPCVCSIKLRIYKNIKLGNWREDFRLGLGSIPTQKPYFVRGPLIQEMEMNPTFVDVMPRVTDMYAYPSHRIYPNSRSLTEITDNNWKSITPGVEFIGEGHTEKINFGCSYQMFTKKPNYMASLIDNKLFFNKKQDEISKDGKQIVSASNFKLYNTVTKQAQINDIVDYFYVNWFVGNSCVDIGDWDIPSAEKMTREGISDAQFPSTWLVPSYYTPYLNGIEPSVFYEKIPYTVFAATNTFSDFTLYERTYCPICSWYGFKGVSYCKANFLYYNKQNEVVMDTVWDSTQGLTWANYLTPPKFINTKFKRSNIEVFSLNKRWFLTEYSTVSSINETENFGIGPNEFGVKTQAYANVPSTPDVEEELPISVKITDPYGMITVDGPIICYDDISGLPEFYPFFRSTLDILGRDKLKKTEENIKIRTYPKVEPVKFITPYKEDSLYLAFDGSPTTFRSSIFNVASKHPYIAEEYIGSSWKLQLNSRFGGWSYQTTMLENIATYQFNMTYGDATITSIIPAFTSPVYVPGNASIAVSAYKDIWINAPPYDWAKKRLVYKFQDEATILPSPFLGLKFYTPNYFNLVEQEIPIYIYKGPSFMMNLETLTFEGDNIVTPLEFNSNQLNVFSGNDAADSLGAILSGTIKFSKKGIVNLRVKGKLKTELPKTVSATVKQELEINFPDFIEIVNYFDKVDENHFNSLLNPLQLSITEAPIIPPNEIVLADTVNKIIGALWGCIEDINAYTKIYDKKTKFYGWMGPEKLFNFISTSSISNIVDWETLSEELDGSLPTWELFESKQAKTKEKMWEHHSSKQRQSIQDPTCNQKYCLDWRWHSRKKKNSKTALVTWANSKLGAPYAKRWNYEPCVSSNSVLNCNRSTWKVSTIDVDQFPPPCMVKVRCSCMDVKMLEPHNKIVVSYPTEINILDTDYAGTLLGRTGIADPRENFSFKNIVSIAVSPTGKLFALDNVLTKLSVFQINPDTFEIEWLDAWGTYGIGEDPREFNGPQSVFVDDQEYVWIADTNNFKIKKFNIYGKHISTISNQLLSETPPKGMCIDSKNNMHVLTNNRVLVFNANTQKYLYQYNIQPELGQANNISCSYNKEMIYITGLHGLAKYYRTGNICYYPSLNEPCGNNSQLKQYLGLIQDKFRNVYVCTMDKLLKIPDLQHPLTSRAYLSEDLYWSKDQILIDKEEYVQDWVYLKSFHRLWDNVELLRNSLFYSQKGCETYISPAHKKEDLILGQNEILTNSIINRLSKQIWENILSLARFFKYRCE